MGLISTRFGGFTSIVYRVVFLCTFGAVVIGGKEEILSSK